MGTVKTEIKQNSCYNGCLMGGACYGHKFEATIQTTSDVLQIKKDGKTILSVAPDEWDIIVEMVDSMGYSFFGFDKLSNRKN